MVGRTYFKVIRAHKGEKEVTVALDELIPTPPLGSVISISAPDGKMDAEVQSIKLSLVAWENEQVTTTLYEQTIVCNAR